MQTLSGSSPSTQSPNSMHVFVPSTSGELAYIVLVGTDEKKLLMICWFVYTSLEM